MYWKSAIVVGSVFLCLRVILCIFFLVVNNFHSFNIYLTTSIVFSSGIGALTDLFLLFGLHKKNMIAICVWLWAQILFWPNFWKVEELSRNINATRFQLLPHGLPVLFLISNHYFVFSSQI